MIRFLAKRLAATIPVLLGVVTVVFFVLHLLPGDPAAIMLGFHVTEERVKVLREEMGLDDPLYVQYGRFISKMIRGDLGRSMSKRRPVAQLIRDQLPATVSLAVAGLGCALVLGILLGVLAATHQGRWLDTGGMIAALLGVSVPSFWLGLILILFFSVKLKLIPILGGGSGLVRLILPAIALGLRSAAMIARLVRSSLLEVLRQEYISTARAKGLSERVVIYGHGLKNALIPVVTVVGLQFGRLLAGSVVIENVFGREGIGSLLVHAIQVQDIPVVQGVVLVTGLIYILVNVLVDMSYVVLDPRVRL
ncbi:MAG: glutathione ABC transporter permease GsiC [Spirochaetales bacterium]|nr:glutathione ABC transporter permease GsiC [Spirochaetales bacterium]